MCEMQTGIISTWQEIHRLYEQDAGPYVCNGSGIMKYGTTYKGGT